MVMERVASEFNKLQYHVSLTNDHPLVEETKLVRVSIDLGCISVVSLYSM